MVNVENESSRNRDLSPYLEGVARTGGIVIPDFLDQKALNCLQPFCVSLNFAAIDGVQDDIVKRLYYLPEFTTQQEETAKILGKHVKEKLSGYERVLPTIRQWSPNEYSAQLYDRGSFISPHKDSPDHEGIVVILSLQGVSTFQMHDGKDSPPAAAWKVKPGDAVILAAKGLELKKGASRYHSVGGAMTDENRVSLKIAYNPTLSEGFSVAPKVV